MKDILNAMLLLASLGCFGLFLIIGILFWCSHGGASYVYFDAQDFVKYEDGAGRKLPVSAKDGRFSSYLQHYIDVTKLLITVAAASIAFAGTPTSGIKVAKVVLAFSILYGVLFCALMLYFYDEYGQDVTYYTRKRYALVESLGFSALGCFIAGYGIWAWALSYK